MTYNSWCIVMISVYLDDIIAVFLFVNIVDNFVEIYIVDILFKDD